MMRAVDRLLGRTEQRTSAPVVIGSFQSWVDFMTQFSFGAIPYTVGGVGEGLEGLVSNVHQRHGAVGAAIAARGALMSQVVPVWENIERSSSDYGSKFGDRALAVFEQPARGITREQLFARAEVHIAFTGNAYFLRGTAGLELLRPDLVDLVWASPVDTDDLTEVVATGELRGYRYWPRGRNERHVDYLASEVAHFAPEPSALLPHIGESWVTAVLRELAVSSEATAHLESFFSNAAVPRTIIRPSKELTPGQVKEFHEVFDEANSGAENAYRTWFIGGGSDVTVVGSDLKDLDLRSVTGHIDTMVAVRSRVPASVLGTREGMEGSALNAGNYLATRRLWADSWFSPYAQGLCSSLEKLVRTPNVSRLTFDPELVLFLQEDRKDAAEIMQLRAIALRQLVDAGFEPESAIDAVNNDNLARLSHSGLTSVQLLPPGEKWALTEGTTPESRPN